MLICLLVNSYISEIDILAPEKYDFKIIISVYNYLKNIKVLIVIKCSKLVIIKN